MNAFDNIGVIKNTANYSQQLIEEFENTIGQFKERKSWSKNDIVELFFKMIPDFGHKETGKYLDGKM
jgi:hypothetical protein